MTDGTSEPVGKYEQSKISLTNKYDEIGIGEMNPLDSVVGKLSQRVMRFFQVIFQLQDRQI